MIYNVNDLFVEINGELFPACNIQVYDIHPQLKKIDDFYYGVYFELMFENGIAVTVHQEAPDAVNGLTESGCDGALNHFLVEVVDLQGSTDLIFHAYHCDSEERLAEVLNTERKLNTMAALVV
jgi:hypothetical protein